MPKKTRDNSRLCNYGDCDIRLPMKDMYLLVKPALQGSPRFCGAPHTLLALAKIVGVHDEVQHLLKEKGF